MVAPNSRPVHPCYLSVFEGSAGSEYSTWAHIASSKNPDLVTAQASTLSVYSVEDSTGKLLLTHTFRNLAGNVCFLETLPGNNGGQDALLIGFSGTPRLSIVTIKSSAPKLLLATTLLDLGPALTQNAYGAVTPLEQDLTASLLLQPKSNSATVAIVLGGGIAVACLSLKYHENSWRVTSEEPYVLPLSALSSKSLDNSKNDAPSNKDLNSQSIVTGFGDILSTTFLPGYLEPTLVMLHSHSQVGRTSSGRLGRQEGAGGTRYSLMVTAVTVTVTHKRSAFLWSTEVPADALHVYRGPQGCLVQCANSIVTIHNTGQVQQCLAVNGWVRSGLSLGLQNIVEANPWPLPKLAISFDGAQFAFVNDTTAFVVLRGGQVYLLQHTANAWSLLPLYISVGAIGQVANLICWPLGNINLLHSKLFDGSKRPVGTNMEMGLLFVGSRLGDSSLLGYALEDTSIADALKNDPGLKAKIDEPGLVNDEVDDYDRILQMEEEALYAPTVDQDDEIVNIIPLSDDEDTKQQQERKRARLSQLKVVRSLTVLDSLTALGPLGPGCNGPISKFLDSGNKSSRAKDAPSMGSTGYIFPCGYGSSGGVGILTAPGRDDRTILAEEDCVNGKAIFSLPSLGIVLLSTAEDGTRFLKLDTTSEVHSMVEINLKEWAKGETLNLLLDTQVLAAYEINAESFALLVVSESSEQNLVYSLVLLGDGSEGLSIQRSATLSVAEGLSINTVTPFTKLELNAFTFGYTLSSGDARFVSVDTSGSLHEFHLRPQIPMDLEGKSEEEQYYSFGNIVALDIFKAPKTFFVSTPLNASEDTSPSGKASVTEQAEYLLDEDDKELYAETARAEAGNLEHEPSPQSEVSVDCEESLYFGLCRQSGLLEIYLVCDLVPGKDADPVWTSFGCGHGVPQLRCTQLEGSAYRAPRMHKIHACEIRFFFCGPSTPQWSSSFKGPRPFCLAIETTAGDTCLYSALVNNQTMALESFDRVPLKSVSRPSQEQYKHFAKLRRKGIVSKTDSEEPQRGFSYNRLFRFKNLSGQDGLFAAVARPIWLIAERGQPIMLCHRSRHAAPAGARPRPVSGFCTGFLNIGHDKSGFMTLHERVGRVGSQRLTVFSGILNLAGAHGLIPGGGLFVEKIPFGVTVRRIQFIDDPSASSDARPLYAVLVSRELETDLSDLNDDGMTAEERRGLIEEKENAKIKRQVEADLGGFDIEQEWVEEIEREDCFKIDKKLGGAPPIQKSVYSLWIVDASNGWVVVDSHEFDEFEHVTTMKVMQLSEFTAEPGSSTVETITEEEIGSKLFISVGTAIVDKDGEDVSSKGRVLLFELKRASETSPLLQSAELNFVYEKKIFHGSVTTLSCLSCEGKNRVVIGAGADVNVEQWGNGKLTQVGFFRATMHVLDIKLFKNFLVLSDAYDSLYFLVWRESDKSLTLLAKDYDPIPVYAAGLLSRGGSLDLVCHDDRQNLQFFQYAPGEAAARGGNKLVCRADFHLGSQTIELQSHFCRSSLLINSATPTSTLAALQQQDTFFGKADDDQRLGIHFGTTDGGYGAVIPLSEPIYWRLTALQSVMVNALESDCALSHRAWRLYRRTPRRGGCRSNDRKKGVIDGDLVLQYADLAVADQEDLASAIGSTVDLILDNLLELQCSSMVI